LPKIGKKDIIVKEKESERASQRDIKGEMVWILRIQHLI
jgi:hypothetical protein